MKSFKNSYLFVLSALSLLIASCSKDDDNIPDTSQNLGNGVFIVNQGGFTASNASLTFYNRNTKKIISDVFESVNGTPLGSVANDAAIYGSKMYITVNVSSTLEIINPKTGKLIKHIDMKNGSVNRQPRYVAFYKNKAYITSYDNTVAVLDTTSLTIEKYINVGRNPEQMAIANGKLYVANSGGLDLANLDHTVSVIDLNTASVIKTIEVPVNPVSLAADAGGDIYVVNNGDYDKIFPSLTIINSLTDEVKSSEPADIGYGSPIAISGNAAYILTGAGKIQVYDTQTDKVVKASFITDNTTFTAPYAIAVNSKTNEIFVTDAENYASEGQLLIFNNAGVRVDSIRTGLIPGKVVFSNN